MRGRLAAAALALAALAGLAAQAQQAAPRDVWPQATEAAREGDFEAATRRANDLLNLGKTLGIKTFPLYAASASGLASESDKQNPDLAAWSTATAARLDGNSPAVIFSESDRAAKRDDWANAIKLALRGFGAVFGNYRTNLLGRADMLITAVAAIFVTAMVFGIALFFRYGRSMAHDFREMLGTRLTGGKVSVLAFALLFLPILLWLGPLWLIFYWLAIFFGYAGVAERIAIAVLLVLVALLPLALDTIANWIAGVDSPAVMAAQASAEQSYHPPALRRLQELMAVAPDNAMLQLLAGNMLVFEGLDEQAAVHYRRASELRRGYAGAHVNRGNLHFLNNEYQAAITEYEKAQRADPDLAIAYYNHSVAAGDTYKFDQQRDMLAKARAADRSYIENFTRNPPPQKIVMYAPPISEAWEVTRAVWKRPAARALFGNYSVVDPATTALNPVTLGALVSLLLALLLYAKRRRNGYANACIKCGRTFCHRCKSSRESATYCTQCIHIYLKRDGVSLDTKRQKLEEVTDHQTGMTRRNRLFATFLPGSAQMLEGRTVAGLIGIFFFALFVAMAIFSGRLAPALGPIAEVAQMIARVGAIVIAVIIWFTLSFPVYRRRSAA